MAPWLTNLFAKGGAKLVDSLGKAFDDNITNKEELAVLKNEALKIVNENLQEMHKLSTEQYKAETDRMRVEIEDRNSARNMQVAALAQNDKFSKRFVYYLAAFVVFSATAFGAGLFFIEVPEQNKRLVEMFSDVFLFGGAILVLNFFFGSSKSSHDKDSIIKESITKQ